jgi:gliding motility-associated-like protein
VFTVTVNPTPGIYIAPVADTLCNYGTSTISVTTPTTLTGGNVTFNYTIDAVSGGIGLISGYTTALGVVINGFGPTIFTQTLINHSNTVQWVRFRIHPYSQNTGAPGDCDHGSMRDILITITVEPTARVDGTISTDTICNNDPITITLASPTTSIYGIRFNVTVINPYLEITGYSNRTDLTTASIINENLNNSGDIARMIMYVIRPATVDVFDLQKCIGINDTIRLWVNPTPRVIPLNSTPDVCDVRNPDPSLRPTSITLTTLSVMTMGVIRFDYTISVTGLPGEIIGQTTGTFTNILPGTNLTYTYQNITDTVRTVSYSVTPKVVGLSCPNGVVEIPEVKIHPLPLPRLPISIDITTPLTCTGGTGLGSLRAITSRGADPYHLVWDRVGGGFHAEDVIDVTNISSGWYVLQATDYAQCYRKDSIQIFPIMAVGVISATIIEPGNYHVTCIGDMDGKIKFGVQSGITPPYRWWIVRGTNDTIDSGVFTNNWNPMDPTTFDSITGLPVGKYTLVVKDVNGCQADLKSVTLRAPPPMISVLKGTNVTCKGYNDGKAWVQSLTGGRGYYKYRWYTFDGVITPPINTNHIDNIPVGTYYLEIKDSLDCIKIDSISITEPDGLSLAGYSLSQTRNNFNISCNGLSDGTINITVAGGSGNYNFSWTGPGGFTSTSEDLTELRAGTYIATIKDNANPLCELAPKPTFTLIEPTALAVTAIRSTSADGSFSINCAGSATGTINLTVTGGTLGTYTYNWSTSNGSGLVSGAEDQLALTAGTYNVVVTDSNLCTTSTSDTLTQPAPLSVNLVPAHITCMPPGFSNGSIDLTPAGGVPPYTYSWSNGAPTQDINNLTEGTYTVTVTDANGCTIAGSVTVNLPPQLTFTYTLSNYNGFNISCYGKSDGSITLGSITGEAPQTFNWTGPGGYTSTSQNISGLGSGTYQLLITDKNMCTASGSYTLTDPGKLDMTITTSTSYFGGFNINCRDSLTGSIDVTPINAAGGVTYLWSDGLVGKTRTKLGAGTYKVIILDQNNCNADTSVILTEPDSIKIEFTVVQAFCPDSPDGQITTIVTGGVITSDYLYKWEPGNMTTPSLTNILEGEYVLTVTDANLCTAQNSIVMEPQNETCLVIPNAISPNDDNINDVWNIGMTYLYPKMEVHVFNSWGQAVWKSAMGYPDPWDGRSNGVKLPIDSYHYTINLHNGSKPILGTITIVR